MSDASLPQCSVVIRCCNEEQHIGRLLSGITQQMIRDVEIIVVDSGSTDATLSIASRYPVKIRHIHPDEFSFGHSLNLGCQVARSEFIVFASAHAYPVYKDWLERLLAPFSDPQVALVYGKQRGNETAKYSEHQVFARWFPNESNSCQDHPFCNNANAAIRRSLWEQIPYDETLTGLEDLDWARRAMEHGYKIVYAADTDIVHVHDELYGQVYNRYRREAIALKRIFPHERFSLWDFIRLFISNTVTDCRHAWRDGALRRNMASILAFRLMQFWGTYRGFIQRSPISNQLRQTFYYPSSWGRARSGLTELDPGRRIEYTGNATEGEVDGDH
jgi:rhamnosyltransferase